MITLNNIPVALGFTPANPPSLCILATWIMLLRISMKAAELREALKSGKPVGLGDGLTLEWKPNDN